MWNVRELPTVLKYLSEFFNASGRKAGLFCFFEIVLTYYFFFFLLGKRGVRKKIQGVTFVVFSFYFISHYLQYFEVSIGINGSGSGLVYRFGLKCVYLVIGSDRFGLKN